MAIDTSKAISKVVVNDVEMELYHNLEDVVITPSTSVQTVTASEGYDGIDEAIVQAVDSSIDSNIQSSNIKLGVTILGVTGNLQQTDNPILAATDAEMTAILADVGNVGKFVKFTGASSSTYVQNAIYRVEESPSDPTQYVVPSGSLSVTSNGTYDVKTYASASVNIQPNLQDKTVTPTTSQQVISADSGYDGLDEVTVDAVTSAIDANIVAGNIKKDVTILGVTGTLEAGGYYPSYAKAMIDGSIYIGNIEIPSDITAIGESAFRDKGNLQGQLIIPNTVTSIGMSAFYDCTGLTGVIISNNVTSIGDFAFYNCRGITNTTIGSGITSLPISCFQNCTSLTNITIPSSVTRIETSAFNGCSGLTSITIPSSVTSIGGFVFSGCSSLTSVTIGSGVTEIGSNMFSSCTSLASITIPSNITYISNQAFYRCTGLTSITIPSSVTYTHIDICDYCSGLTKVTYEGQAPDIKSNSYRKCNNIMEYDFSNCTTIPTLYSVASLGHKSNCVIKVPNSLLTDWQASTNWSSLTDVIWQGV